MLPTRSLYEVARATVAVLIVKVADMLKVPIAAVVNVLKALASAPCTPVLRLIASA